MLPMAVKTALSELLLTSDEVPLGFARVWRGTWLATSVGLTVLQVGLTSHVA